MKGQLIVVWNPICNRAGASSLTLNIGTVLSWIAFRKVHISNLSCDSAIETYFKDDMKINYTLDNLKILRESIDSNSVKMYSTAINDKLNIIGGYQIEKGLIEGVENFSLRYLDEALELNDYVIVDLSNQREYKILEKADTIISVMPMDKILLEKAQKTKEWEYVLSEKSITVFNNLPIGIEDEIAELARKYNLTTTCHFPSDPNIQYYTSLKNNLYSYVVEELKKRKIKDLYINQLQELMHLILMKEDEELYNIGKKSFWGSMKTS